MSMPSTPSRSAPGSLLSSPANRDGSPGQLTPRSKVRAMLAALDDDSDDNSPSKPALSHPEATFGAKRSSDGNPVPLPAQSGSDEDDSDVAAPRGKLASRLHSKHDTALQRGDADAESGFDAYTRVKERLLRKSPVPADTPMEDKEGEHSPPDGATGWTKKVLRRKKQKVVEPEDDESTFEGRTEKADSLEDPRISKSPELPPLSSSEQGPTAHSPLGTPRTTQAQSAHSKIDQSDHDLPDNPLKNARFLELVAQKRKEREAREAEEERKRAERQERLGSTRASKLDRSTSDISGVESEGEDAATGRRLTQQSRPTRKASKKALEEMSRETQRLSRNMQLAHEAKTRKKITKDSLLERFNFRKVPGAQQLPAQQSSSSGISSVPVSDTEGAEKHQTPLTSPDSRGKSLDAQKTLNTVEPVTTAAFDADEDLPSLEEVLASQPVSKGKGKAIQEPTPEEVAELEKSKRPTFTQPPITVRPPKYPVQPEGFSLDSDSDLEVLPVGDMHSRKSDIFDRLPAAKAAKDPSLIKLRALAHLTSPSKQKKDPKSSMNSLELQASLRRRARQQAAKERSEKIQELRNRGVHIQTAEERERDTVTIEDMYEKARQEAEKLTKKEKEATKREKRENGEDSSGLDSSEDEDYKEREDEADIELSGSDEDQEEQDDEQSIQGQETGMVGSLIDNEAFEDSNDNESSPEDEVISNDNELELDRDSDEDLNIRHVSRKGKLNRVLDEDDDVSEGGEEAVPDQDVPSSTRSITNPFGARASSSKNPPMGLTQAFASTMVGTLDSNSQENEDDSLAMLSQMPTPDFPILEEGSIVRDSQMQADDSLDIDLHYTQSQTIQDTVPGDPIPVSTQLSQIPDPTQDAGFEKVSPIATRFVPVPPSTVDTVILPPEVVHESPIVRKKGRLHRRTEAITTFSDAEDEGSDLPSEDDRDDFEISANAFDVMKKATRTKRLVEAYNKKESNAKDMVEEQAQESEDEYAGLGGASDDDSEAEEDEEVKKMIDEGQVDVDERKLAAFYADKERASDEKAVEKLFKDINSGLLRRKRGADFDLSDSDDEAEARRARKRREFAQMRKALFEDEAVGKIAEDPKKLAFIRAIEDREDEEDDDIDILDATPGSLDPGSTQEVPDSQTENHPAPAEITKPTTSNVASHSLKRKRPLEESHPTALNRPPPSARRTVATRKPATLAEIRASVSFLTEDPHSIPQSFIEDASSDLSASEDNAPDDSTRPGTTFTNPRRTNPTSFVDRLSLKRQESSSLSTTTLSNSRLAFADPNAQATAPGSKVPSLLRRATTGLSSISAADEHGISTRRGSGTERMAGGGEGVGVRKGSKGSKKSSVQYFAREMERRERVREEEVRREREEARAREEAAGRRTLGTLLRSGRFE